MLRFFEEKVPVHGMQVRLALPANHPPDSLAVIAYLGGRKLGRYESRAEAIEAARQIIDCEADYQRAQMTPKKGKKHGKRGE